MEKRALRACVPRENLIGIAEFRPPSSARVLPAVIRERTREGRDGGATGGVALPFVEVFAVVRQ